MDEKTGKKRKPLRTPSKKAKDIIDTYLKNEEGRVIPIKEKDPENKIKSEKSVSDDNIEKQLEKEIAEKIKEESIEEEAGIGNQEVELLVKQLNEIEKERDDLKDRLARKAAELENVRRRTQREKQNLIEFANEKVLLKLLDVLDDTATAIDHGKNSDDYSALLIGVEMINKKTIKLFENEGVKAMENPVGKEFDVDFHEAMMVMPSEDIPEDHIVQVVQTGYMMYDKVLRHAKVITSYGKTESNDS